MTAATLERMGRHTVIALATMLIGCAASAHDRGAGPATWEEDDPRAAPAQQAEAEPRAEPTLATEPEIPKTVAGEISRPLLSEVLDAGPGRFLAGIELEPVFRAQKFAGWQIVRFEPANTRIARAPLRSGDIVFAVNAQPIAKPQQLQELWDQLRTATELVVAGERRGRPFELRYSIHTP